MENLKEKKAGRSISTRTRYTLIGSDFSQQEVRVLADMSRDPNLIKAYQENKDIYATVASGVYGMDYWDCMEHHQDGTANVEGKKRRSFCKSIVLGIMYSRGANAIAEQIGKTKEEAQQIIDNFYKSFPVVKAWMDESLKSLKETGYTTDFYGRRRRLPDINIDPYKVSSTKSITTFNPFINCENKIIVDQAVTIWKSILGSTIINSNLTQLTKNNKLLNLEMSNKKYEDLAKLAISKNRALDTLAEYIKVNNNIYDSLKRGYFIKFNFETKLTDTIYITPELEAYCKRVTELYPIIPIQSDLNKFDTTPIIIDAFTGRIAQAARQCVNAKIQGSSATMTKVAMNKIFRDPELNSYGFKLLINVHDELIGQCKVEYADKCAERLTTVMKTCVSDMFVTPFKCDPDICRKWYASEVANELQETKEKMLKDGNTEEEVFDLLCNKYSEFLPEEINTFLAGNII